MPSFQTGAPSNPLCVLGVVQQCTLSDDHNKGMGRDVFGLAALHRILNSVWPQQSPSMKICMQVPIVEENGAVASLFAN